MNKPVPIICIHEGSEVLVGGTLGKVQALSLEGTTAKVTLSRAAPVQASEFSASIRLSQLCTDLCSGYVQAIVSSHAFYLA